MAAKEEKAKFRVFFGEIEGDNQTIREGLKSIASAVNRTFSSDTRTVRLINVGGDGPGKITSEEIQEIIDSEEIGDTAMEVDSPDAFDASPPKSKKPRRAPSYSLVKDLNLMPEGRESFTHFFGRKKPEGPQETLTVCVYWLSKIAEITGIGPNHLYTCLKEAKVSVPNDIAQVCRNIANRKGWIDTRDGNDLKVTINGENHVEHKMPDHLNDA